MNTRLSLLLVLLTAFLSVDLVAQSPSSRRRRSNTKQDKPLSERDPELHQWVQTLIINLQKDHKRIRNSAAQGLISVGAEAAPALMALREQSNLTQQRMITRILQRISRSSGKNLFKTEAGGAPPSNVTAEIMTALSLKPEKREKLNAMIVKVQEKRRTIDQKYRAKKISPKDRMIMIDRLRSEVEAEAALFLDPEAVNYVTVKLGLNPRAAKGGEKDPRKKEQEDQRRRERRKRETGGN